MSLPKVQETRELSDDDLKAQILTVKKELFDVRFKQATRQPVQPHQFKHAKHRLSQLLTVERERLSRA